MRREKVCIPKRVDSPCRERKCRCNWHSGLGWQLPVLKCKYIFFQIKYTEAFYQTALGICYGLKLARCCLQYKN